MISQVERNALECLEIIQNCEKFKRESERVGGIPFSILMAHCFEVCDSDGNIDIHENVINRAILTTKENFDEQVKGFFEIGIECIQNEFKNDPEKIKLIEKVEKIWSQISSKKRAKTIIPVITRLRSEFKDPQFVIHRSYDTSKNMTKIMNAFLEAIDANKKLKLFKPEDACNLCYSHLAHHENVISFKGSNPGLIDAINKNEIGYVSVAINKSCECVGDTCNLIFVGEFRRKIFCSDVAGNYYTYSPSDIISFW